MSVKDFEITAQFILAMNMVLEHLYAKLPDIFRNGTPLIDSLTESIGEQEKILSDLKTGLYHIYEAEKAYSDVTGDTLKGKVEIKYDDKTLFIGGRKKTTINDPLVDIPPTLSEIEALQQEEEEGAVLLGEPQKPSAPPEEPGEAEERERKAAVMKQVDAEL